MYYFIYWQFLSSRAKTNSILHHSVSITEKHLTTLAAKIFLLNQSKIKKAHSKTQEKKKWCAFT